jgi:hypothetical protein
MRKTLCGLPLQLWQKRQYDIQLTEYNRLIVVNQNTVF